MITQVSEFLQGLTSEILDRAIPPILNLRIVSGFIHDGQHNLTGQIDCMLVKGDGEIIPYTDDYKWHIKDVLAVFEVKKILYGNDLEDAFEHLKGVKASYSSFLKNTLDDTQIDISSAKDAFSQMTRIVAPIRSYY